MGLASGQGAGGEVPGRGAGDAGTTAGLLALPAAAACPHRCHLLSWHSWSLAPKWHLIYGSASPS